MLPSPERQKRQAMGAVEPSSSVGAGSVSLCTLTMVAHPFPLVVDGVGA